MLEGEGATGAVVVAVAMISSAEWGASPADFDPLTVAVALCPSSSVETAAVSGVMLTTWRSSTLPCSRPAVKLASL